MYDTLLRLYLQNKLTDQGLTNAVNKEWISEDEKIKIIQTKVGA